MAKINIKKLMEAVNGSPKIDSKVEEAGKWLKSSGLSTTENIIVDGLINSATAAEIESIVNDLINTLKETKKFSLGKHIIKPLLVLSKILSLFDISVKERPAQEEMVTEIVLDLFDRYAPSIKWVPSWLSKWVGKKLINKYAPVVVDELFDLLHGEDDKE